MVDLQSQPQPPQSHPKCMNWISKSWTSRVAPYFKLISGSSISRDWTHFLPLKLMCGELCLWKIWLVVYFLAGTCARPSWPSLTIQKATAYFFEKFFRIASYRLFFLQFSSIDCNYYVMIWSAVLRNSGKNIFSALSMSEQLADWSFLFASPPLKSSWESVKIINIELLNMNIPI